jgi:hypothetical protein
MLRAHMAGEAHEEDAQRGAGPDTFPVVRTGQFAANGVAPPQLLPGNGTDINAPEGQA